MSFTEPLIVIDEQCFLQSIDQLAKTLEVPREELVIGLLGDREQEALYTLLCCVSEGGGFVNADTNQAIHINCRPLRLVDSDDSEEVMIGIQPPNEPVLLCGFTTSARNFCNMEVQGPSQLLVCAEAVVDHINQHIAPSYRRSFGRLEN